MVERIHQDCKRNIYDKKAPVTDFLTREQVIEAIQFEFDHKLEGQKRMFEYRSHHSDHHKFMDIMLRVEKMRFTDQFSLKFTIEHDDFEACCEKFDIRNSEEYAKILDDYCMKCAAWMLTLEGTLDLGGAGNAHLAANGVSRELRPEAST